MAEKRKFAALFANWPTALVRDGAVNERKQARDETAGNNAEGQIFQERQAEGRDQHALSGTLGKAAR
jgi:hypothetical protein